MKLLTIACVALTLAAAPKAKSKKAVKGASDAGVELIVDAGLPPPPPPERPSGYPDIDKMPFTPVNIQTVVGFWNTKIQGCYEETLANKEKALEGKLMTSFVIMPNGLVKKQAVVKKGTTVKEPKLFECVLAVIATMQFPKPADGKDHPIEYPFNLKAIE